LIFESGFQFLFCSIPFHIATKKKDMAGIPGELAQAAAAPPSSVLLSFLQALSDRHAKADYVRS